MAVFRQARGPEHAVAALSTLVALQAAAAQFNEAHAHYTQAMKYNPDHLDTLNNLGALNGQIGR